MIVTFSISLVNVNELLELGHAAKVSGFNAASSELATANNGM